MDLKKKAYIKAFLGLGIFCIAAMAAFGQQGGLDTFWGTNSTGIYQDPLPALNDPLNIARVYGPIEVLANGKIVVAGSGTKSNGVNDIVIRRLNADGSEDGTFAGGAGNVEMTFYTFNSMESNMLQPVMAIQPADGKIIIAAQCNVNFAPPPDNNRLGSDLCLMRFNADGTLDTGFGGNTVTAYGGNPNFPPQSYTMDPGKVWTYTGVNQVLPTVNGNFNGIPVRIRIATDGRICVFGNSRDFLAPNQIARYKGFVAVYSTSGALQSITNLNDITGNKADGFGQTYINDGDILSNGDFLSVGSQSRLVSSNPAVFTQQKWAIFRNGTTMFLDQVNNALPEAAHGLVQLRSNKILVSGGTSGNGATFVRYNGNLSVDTTFGTGGRLVPICNGAFCIGGAYAGAMKSQPDGKVVGFGDAGDLFRINPDGSPDRSFALFCAGGCADNLASRGILRHGRYSTPFPTRGSDLHIYFGGLAERPNGKLIASGRAGSQADVAQLLTSFRNGGTLADFNNDGKAEIAVYRPSNGAWYQLDSFDGTFSGIQFGISTDRITPADYDGDGKTDKAVYRDGTWYVLRSSDNQLAVFQWGVAGDIPRPGDFNGDGQADIAVFRPSNGTWYILYSNPIQPGNVTYSIVQFGQTGDIPLLADFDGDGKSDIAVFRSGVWYYLRSSNGSVGIAQFGVTGDIPVTGDYDADGKSDLAVFRSGTWYALRSSDSGLIRIGWGAAGDKPVPGDYDNDGINDFAIYRNGVWWVLRSSDGGFSATSFGLPTDNAVPAAYIQ